MRHVNFIPYDLRPKLEIPQVLIPAGLFLVLFFYTGGTLIWNVISTHSTQTELSRIDSENTVLTKKIESLSATTKRLKLDEAIEGMKKVLAKKNYWSGIFKEMSVLIPEGVWLTGFSDTKEVQSAAGTSSKIKSGEGILLIKGESVSQEIVAQFLTVLEKSPHFAGVQIKFSEKEPDIRPARYKFEFSIPIKAVTNEGA